MKCETQHRNYSWLAGRTWFGVWITLLVVLGFVGFACAQRGTRSLTLNSQLSTLNQLAPSLAAVVAPTNRPVIARFAWDASPDSGVTNYALWWGTRSRTYTNSANFGTNLSGTLSNQFISGVKYYVAVTAQDRTGIVSDFSNEAIWPVPLTNYVGVVVTTRSNLTAPATVLWQTIRTNPPAAAEFFETKIWTTNSSALVTRINTSTLQLTNTTSK